MALAPAFAVGPSVTAPRAALQMEKAARGQMPSGHGSAGAGRELSSCWPGLNSMILGALRHLPMCQLFRIHVPGFLLGAALAVAGLAAAAGVRKSMRGRRSTKASVMVGNTNVAEPEPFGKKSHVHVCDL